MKHLLQPFALLCLSILLTACSASDNKSPPSQAGNILSGNMQKNVPSGNFVSVDNMVLFIAANKSTGEPQLYSYNADTKSVTTFCRDATCNHNTASCVSGGVNSNLESYNGEIYGKSGSNAGKVMRLNNGRFEPVIDSGVSHFFHAGDNLYAATADSSLVVFDGNSEKPSMLLDEYTGYWETIFDGYLYYQFDGVARLDLSNDDAMPQTLVEHAAHITDGKHIYYANNDDFLLYRCGMDGSGSEKLTDFPVLVASWNFDDEYFYFRYYTDEDIAKGDSRNIYRLSKEEPAQVERIAELPVPAYQIFTDAGSDILFVTVWGEDENIYAVSKENKTVGLLEF